MCTITERIKIANKQYYCMEDTRKLMGISYQTMKPLWEEFCNHLLEKNIRVPKYGVKSSIVREYFGIDYDLLMKEYEFEKNLNENKKGIVA